MKNMMPETITITPETTRGHRKEIMRECLQSRQDQTNNLFANGVT